MTDLRVAIVHDWLVGGGAELVVEELHKMYPDAPIYTSYCSDEWREKLGGKVRTSYLQNWPLRALRKFIPLLRIVWFSRLNFDEYDLVISSSGAEAKGIKVNKPTIHINYCHAPTHYYWSRYDEYLKHPGFGFFDPLAKIGLRLLVGPLRRWDYKAAQRPDYIIANSNYTKNQIKKYYNRDSVVVHPPVDVEFFSNLQSPISNPQKRSGFVIAGRQTPYKRFDLAVAACTQLNLQLNVVGDGPDNKKLRRIAGPSVSVLGRLPRAEVRDHFQKAQAFIFPALDDFGVVALEAMAAGTPVIAYKAGGALDYVVNDRTGLFFEPQTAESLAKTLQEFNKLSFNHSLIAKAAGKFSAANFRKSITRFLEKNSATG